MKSKCCGAELNNRKQCTTCGKTCTEPESAEGIEEFKSNFPTKEQVVYIVDKEIGTWNFTEYFEEKLKQFISTQIAKAKKEGAEEEREKIKKVIKKERETWAKESIGDRALQSFENAFNQLT